MNRSKATLLSSNDALVESGEPKGGTAPPAPAASDEPINILLVDDEPKNLKVLETVLEDPGYRLVCAQSAEQALLALVAEEFALLVLDIHMPQMSGFELAQLVKQRKKTAALPIIFLTAYYSEDQHVLEGYGTGAVDYLHKPINPTILRSKVAVFAELHRKSRETARVNRSLLNEVSARRVAEEQLRKMNDELEARVSERTMALVERERELRGLAEALKNADRRKDEFLATLAHELRNPLAPLRSGLELLKMSDDPADARDTQTMMDRQLCHMVRLIDDLLDLSRITTDKLTLRKKPVLLSEVIETAIDASNPVLGASGQTLTVAIPEEEVWLDADPTRLSQVVGNLLTNASKYTPSGGRIEIEAARQAAEVSICVKDDGLGIPPEMLADVFEMFTQVNRTLDRAQGGLGIGLAIVKRLVELHRGTITALSPGLGRGSAFTVRLPIVLHHAQQTSSSATPHAAPARSQKAGCRVLVVDDNVDGAVSLEKVLRIWGYETQINYSGTEALESARTFKPDVVFLDIGLPGMNGYEVARHLRGEPALCRATLVAVTGWGSEEDKQRSRDAGFDFHLTKPVEVDAIEKILARVATTKG
jgi:signal transduction histidine kinase